MFSFLRHNPQKNFLERAIHVGERTLPLKIKVNNRSKRISLRIDQGGRGLSLTMPDHLSDREVENFLEKHHGWILTNLAKFPKENDLKPGGLIPLRGIEHQIEWSGQLRGMSKAINQGDKYILSVAGGREYLSRRIADFFKKEARKDLQKSTEHHAQKLGCTFKSITLRDTRSRWGSCSYDGKLSYSWRLIMAPPFVLDYLTAHEVAHLAEMNHGPEFWQICENLCPHMLEGKKWLKKNGSLLHAIDFGV